MAGRKTGGIWAWESLSLWRLGASDDGDSHAGVRTGMTAGWGRIGLLEILHIQDFPVPGKGCYFSVPDEKRLTQKQKPVIVLVEVAPIGQREEGMPKAVGIGDVLKEPQAVQDVVLDLLIVGQDIDAGEGQAGGEAGEIRGGFALLLGLDIYLLGGVHGASADAHDHSGEPLQNFPQMDVPKKGVLGGDVASGKDDKIADAYQFLRVPGVGPVQHMVAAEKDPGLGAGADDIGPELTGQVVALRVGGHEQAPAIGGQGLPEPVHKAVGVTENRPVRPVHKGAAGNENNHGNPPVSGWVNPGKAGNRGNTPVQNPLPSPERTCPSEVPGSRHPWER